MPHNRPVSRLVLLDTGVVIEAFRTGAWGILFTRFKLVVSEAIMEEAKFYVEGGVERPIDLSPDIRAGRVEVVGVPASEAMAFRARFKRDYLERIHAGELELLADLMRREEGECRIASGDGIVYKILGFLGQSHRGVSLEELLHEAGQRRDLGSQFTKASRLHYAQLGLGDAMDGGAVR